MVRRNRGRGKAGASYSSRQLCYLERQLLEVNGEIDGHDGDAGGRVQGNRREVEQAQNAGGQEALRRCLGLGGRNGDDSDADLFRVDDGRELGHGSDDETIGLGQGASHEAHVGVKNRRDAEAPAGEPTVGGQGPSQIACSDEGGCPDVVGAEDQAGLFDESVDTVSEPRTAELAEVGEILSDLRVGDAQSLSKLLA